MSSLGYPGLFLSSLLAATLVPFSSEVLLAGMLAAEEFDPALLLLAAATGNTLGSVTNWILGRFCLHWQDRRWFPLGPDKLAQAQVRFARWGVWSLLFAWLPLVGDPLTFAAGVLRVNFWAFVVLVGIGKTARYIAVIYVFEKIA